MSLISTHGVGMRFGGRHILRDINLSIREREIVTIVGPNGSGKTTLLRILIGAQSPTEGVVTRGAGVSIGYVPQRLAIDRSMPLTVSRWLRLAGAHQASDRQRMAERVDIVGLLEEQMTSLSGGEFQRALLAQALLARPALLVLDEPTQGLDQPAVASFYRLIETVRGEIGCAVLMVSHDLHVVMRSSDHVICLNGHVCCEGTPTVVSAAPEYQALFGFGAEGALALYRHEHDHRHDHADTTDTHAG